MIKMVNLENAKKTPAHYSAAIRADNVLYVSGQLPLDPVTREARGKTIYEQTLQALTNIENLIKQENGGDRNQIVKTTAYVSDIAAWDEVNRAYKDFFGEYKPARTISEVHHIHFGFFVEIDATAVLNA